MIYRRMAVPAALAFGFSPTSASAHHAMGGATPDTLIAGLLSGLGHPVIGIDHLAFVVAVGILSALAGRPRALPLAFVVATVAGCVFHLTGMTLPFAEIVIAASVVGAGALAVRERAPAAAAVVSQAALAGVFHGWAYGESIVGAEATPLGAYLVGFALVQFAIAVAAGRVIVGLRNTDTGSALHPRLAGAVVAGIGIAFLVEAAEGLMFA
jgi:urease accessory protein